MTTISPFSLSLPYRTENRRFSTLSCTKTGSTQPKLSAACFVVQSCLADADFVVSSNYCLIGTRQKGCFFFALPRGSGCFPRRARRENAACAPQHQGGIFSFEKENIPLCRVPTRCGDKRKQRLRRCKSRPPCGGQGSSPFGLQTPLRRRRKKRQPFGCLF